MEANLRRTEVAVKNIDNREHDLFDSDDYFQYHGGMIAAVRVPHRQRPQGVHWDSADPSRVKTRDLVGGSPPRVPLARGEPKVDLRDAASWLQGRL
jgi:cobalamin biosynthesis Mg chelatase CobN